jgi:hypothetical protein
MYKMEFVSARSARTIWRFCRSCVLNAASSTALSAEISDGPSSSTKYRRRGEGVIYILLKHLVFMTK